MPCACSPAWPRHADARSRPEAAGRGRVVPVAVAVARALALASAVALALPLGLGLGLGLGGCATTEGAIEAERRGLELLQQGREAEAAVELERSVELDPTSYQAVMALATVRSRQGRRLEALTLMERLAADQPDLSIARMALGDMYSAFGMDDQALGEYRAVAALWNTAFGPAYLGMATIHERRREDQEAMQALLRAIELMPASPEPIYRLAHLYEDRGLAEAAAKVWSGYLVVALQNGREDPARLAHARERLRAHGAAGLDAATAAEVVGELRRLLAPKRQGAPLEGAAPAATAATLARPFYGRVLARLHAAGQPGPLAGLGRGATLGDAAQSLARDLERLRPFELDVARRLDTVRVEVAFEAGPEVEAAVVTGTSGAPEAIGGFAAQSGAVEVRLKDGRSTVLLPSDLAREGVGDGEALLGVVALRLGAPPEQLAGARVTWFPVVGFVEAVPLREVLPLQRGLVTPVGPTAEAALRAARAAAERLRDGLGTRGRFLAGFDALRARPLPGDTSAAEHARVAATLARASRRLDDRRLGDTAQAALGMLLPAVVARGEGTRIVATLAPRRQDAAASPAPTATATSTPEALLADDGAPADLEATAEASLLAEALGRPPLALELARGLAAEVARRGDLDAATLGRVALALARAGRAHGQAALEEQAAGLAERLLASASGTSGDAAGPVAGPGPGAGGAPAGTPGAVGPGGRAGGGTGVGATAAATAAAEAEAAARAEALLLAMPALAALHGGPCEGRARAAIIERAPAVLAAIDRDPFALTAAEALAALVALPREARPDDLARRVDAALRAAAALGYDRTSAFAAPGLEGDLEGYFRRGPLDPRAFAIDAARRLDAILALAASG